MYRQWSMWFYPILLGKSLSQLLMRTSRCFPYPHAFITSSLLRTLGWWPCFLLSQESFRNQERTRPFSTEHFTKLLSLYWVLLPFLRHSPSSCQTPTHAADATSLASFPGSASPICSSLFCFVMILSTGSSAILKYKFSLDPLIFSINFFWWPWGCAGRSPMKGGVLDWGPQPLTSGIYPPWQWVSARCTLLPARVGQGR